MNNYFPLMELVSKEVMEINFGLTHYKVLLNWYELIFAKKNIEPTEEDVDTLQLIIQMMKQEIRNFDNRKIGTKTDD